MSDHPWLDSVPAFALDALDADERDEFADHLAQCERCRSAVAEYRETVAALSSATAVEPPPRLRRRVLSEAGASVAADGPPASGGTPDAREAVIPLAPRRRVLPWLAAAAAIVLAMWAGYEARTRSLERDAYQADLVRVREQLTALQSEAVRRDSMLAALSGARVQTATLTRSGGEPQVRLFWNRARNLVLVTAFDLSPAAEGRTYQLWGIVPGSDPVSLGVFDTEPDGTAVVVRALGTDLSFALSAVTDEPAGGSPQPTSDPFLVGEWSAGVP